MREPTPESDEELLARSAAGDEGAFTALYRRRQGNVFRFALHMCGREDAAEEVVQEVFLTVIREPQRFDPSRGTVASFLLGVARNHVLRWLERERSSTGPEDATDSADLLGEMTRRESIEAVRKAVLTLPAVYREAVVICDLQEMSYLDAAGILQVPVGTVRSRLNRGRGMLVEKLRAARCAV